MLNVISVKEAQSTISENFKILMPPETVDILSACNRVLASEVASGEYVPGFDRSMVDGYAVKAADTFGADEATPAMLEYKGEVLMGEAAGAINKGECLYVPTGGEIPEGADAMVMIEHTEEFGGMRLMLRPTAPGRHVSFKGDDVKQGAIVLKPGKKLYPQDIGILAALGVKGVSVRKKPKIGIVSTGDEIVAIDQKLTPTQIRDVNSYLLHSSIAASGGEPVLLGIVGDDFDLLKQTVSNGVDSCDMLIVSGSSSVGEKDYARLVIDALIKENSDSGLLFHGVAMKPGKPTLFGKVKGKPVIGLPGHPAAVYFTYQKFVAELIKSMLGSSSVPLKVDAKLKVNIPSNHGREEYIPVMLEEQGGRYSADPIIGKSGLISILSRADGYICVERDSEGYKEGDGVKVFIFESQVRQ